MPGGGWSIRKGRMNVASKPESKLHSCGDYGGESIQETERESKNGDLDSFKII
jgi:hypothetical protein